MKPSSTPMPPVEMGRLTRKGTQARLGWCGGEDGMAPCVHRVNSGMGYSCISTYPVRSAALWWVWGRRWDRSLRNASGKVNSCELQNAPSQIRDVQRWMMRQEGLGQRGKHSARRILWSADRKNFEGLCVPSPTPVPQPAKPPRVRAPQGECSSGEQCQRLRPLIRRMGIPSQSLRHFLLTQRGSWRVDLGEHPKFNAISDS